MKIPQSTPTLLSLAVAATFCFSPATWAQSAGQSQNPQNPPPLAPVAQSSAQANTSLAPQDQQKPRTGGTTVDPSQAPLQPVTTYPDAAGNPQLQAPTTQPQSTTASQSQVPGQQTEPQGSATAEKVPTAGGAAAKPAGAAIAPAKQRQARSLLIKMGAVVAGAVAAGTIYALSKGTPSTPPGSTSPSAVQKR